MVGRKTTFFSRTRNESIDITTIELLQPDENYGKFLIKKSKLLSSKLGPGLNQGFQLQ